MYISIITICKNNIEGIKKTINSVDAQSSSGFEHILIDGDSTDGTKEYIFEHSCMYRTIVSEPDTGISNAFNKGLKIATGEFILFLNSGDTFSIETVIEDVIKDIENAPDYDIYTYIGKIGGHTVPEKTERKYADEYWALGRLPHQATFVNKSVFEQIGEFDESLRLRMDYDFFYRCFKTGFKYLYIPRIVVDYEDGGACIRDLEQFALEGCIVQKRYEGHLGKQSVDELVSIYSSNYNDLKILKMYYLMELIAMNQNGDRSISSILLKNGIQKVAIYGKGRLGKALYNILTVSGVAVGYYIDRFSLDEDVYSFDLEWPDVDSIIVSVVDGIKDIKEDIKCKTDMPVLSIEEIFEL